MSSFTINAPPEAVFHQCQNIAARVKWDENIESDVMLEGDCYHGVERVLLRSPLIGFANREIIRHRSAKANAFKYPYLAFERSTNSYDGEFPVTKKRVRVNLAFSGNTIYPGKKPWTSIYGGLCDANPGGSIPGYAVNMVINRVPKELATKIEKSAIKMLVEKNIKPSDPDVKEKLAKLLDF